MLHQLAGACLAAALGLGCSDSGPAALTTSTDSLDFGEVPVGESVPLDITISNHGSGGARIEGPTFSGASAAAFAADGDDWPVEVLPNGSLTILIHYRPEDLGADEAIATISAAHLDYVAASGGDGGESADAEPVPDIAITLAGVGVLGEGVDADGDGFVDHETGGDDCDDTDPSIHPGAVDVCGDDIDNNCDGIVDEGLTVDEDGDGFSPCLGDCDDSNADIFDDAPELCDSLDNNCNEQVDEGWDNDKDGFSPCAGDCDDTLPSINPAAEEGCDLLDSDCDGNLGSDEIDGDSDGVAPCEGDCDDEQADSHPGAVEICDGEDNDCNGLLPSFEHDLDGDGVLACDGDCNDNSADISPLATEICDGIDNNCDLSVPASEIDNDGDGLAECGGDCDDGEASIAPGATEQCNGIDDDCSGGPGADELDLDGDGVATCAGDCDDSSATVSPLAPELCNGIDDDCDGSPGADEIDGDGDGVTACDGDCQPSEATVYPGAAEGCDGIDSDCDGLVGGDEFDNDGDGFTECGGDCLDLHPNSYPGAPELCDLLDNDCDGAPGATESDNDGDGWAVCQGDCEDSDATVYRTALESCNGQDDNCDSIVPGTEIDSDGDGLSACNGDCQEGDAAVYPGATETCDGQDNDCNGISHDLDEDGDGYYPVACGGGDCDDSTTGSAINPGTAELCDGIDQDCDGTADNGFPDQDGDGTANCVDGCPVYVDGSHSGSSVGIFEEPFVTVQDGIDNHGSCDTVEVAAGTYNEDINFGGQSITVRSADGPGQTFLVGTGTSSVVTINSGENTATSLEGFDITGGVGTVDDSIAGMFVDPPGRSHGGGIFVKNSDPTIDNCVIHDMTVSGKGGGIIMTFSEGQLLDTSIIGNTALADNNGGGGAHIGESEVFVHDCTFEDNNAGGGSGDGGGLCTEGGANIIDGNLFHDNDASNNGSGVRLTGDSVNTFRNNLVVNNTGHGVMSSHYNASVLVNNTIVGNGSTGLYVFVCCGTTFAMPTVANNIIVSNGEGIRSNTSLPFSLLANDVFGNGSNYAGLADSTGIAGNISTDPLFVTFSNDGDLSNDDFALQSNSPCLDSGLNTAVYGVTTDFLGNSRPVDGDGDGSPRFDMGAFERQ